MKKRLILFLAMLIGSLAIIQSTRADSKNTTTFTSPDGQYQLTLPDGWTTADFQVATAAITAMNKHRGEYVELIVEDQANYTNSLLRYAQAKRDTMALSLDNPKLSQPVETKINGYDAVWCEIHGQLPNTDTSVGYLLTVLKTKGEYIQIVTWTKDSQFGDRKSELQALANGFSEATGSAK
jgi:hypothetical protein